MSAVFTSFADLAAHLNVKVKPGKKLRKAMPETAFIHVAGIAGKPAALVWACINDRESNKKAGLAGSPIVPIADIVDDTGMDEDAVVTGIIRLAKNGLISKVTPLGIAA